MGNSRANRRPAATVSHQNTNENKIYFSVTNGHSRQLAPGISIGVDRTDPIRLRMDGWMWIMPDRHTVWLKRQPVRQPVLIYQNGEQYKLVINQVAANSASGYLYLR
jgi:hypothetical protein